MPMRATALVLLVGLAGLLPLGVSAKSAPGADAAPLTSMGWGPLEIGMSLEEVTEALGPDSDPEAVGGPDPEFCDQFRPEGAPEGLLVMIKEGVLTRISIFEPAEVETDRGFGIGSEADEIKAAYGDEAEVMTHFYIGEPAEYITVWTQGEIGPDGTDDPDARGIRYETDENQRVTMIHVGGPSIQYIEGCS